MVNVVDDKQQPVAGAVVFLESAAASAALAAQTAQHGVAGNANIIQRDKTFVPEVTVIPKGTAINFPNEDTVRHHVYSFSAVKPFEIKLYVGTPAAPVLFEQSGVAVLGCNIHDHMIAWVVVMDTPYYAQTAADGAVTLSDVPAGTYQLRVWHKDLMNESAVPSIPLDVTANMAVQHVTLPELIPMH